ncbi:MAG: UDP-N-acetylmuramoyl-tripeptide--D-alanyl-D-alanine ligase [Desulfobacterales bacterium]
MAETIWTGEQILKATGADRVCGDPSAVFSNIGIDSRTVAADELFVAVRGEVHDGHRFAPAVVDAGCRGLLVGKEMVGALPVDRWRQAGAFCAAVADTRRALGDLAAFHRNRCPVQVVAVTGSNGKTSTREMTVSVVSRLGPTLAPTSNFNNDIGVPLTLFNLRGEHRLAVLELGMNHFGEIARLTEICRPDIGVITNVGPAHLEGVGSLEGVKAAKGELLEQMAPDRRAVLNGDDPRVMDLARNTHLEVLLFGTAAEAQIRAEEIGKVGDRVGFMLVLPSGRVPVMLATPARFMVFNALAAAGVGHLLGIDPVQIREGLETFSPIKGRMTIIETEQGVTIIDDTYNANPGSMAGVIETLVQSEAPRRILVIGDMRELGDSAEALHRDLGRTAAGAGLDRLYVTGVFSDAVAEGALAGGMDPETVLTGGKEDILAHLLGVVRPGDRVAVKGSRSVGMETIVEGLLARLKRRRQKVRG